jgi:hypothetical protein
MSERPEVRSYKQSLTFEQRSSRSADIISSYQDNVPILCLPGAGVENVKAFKFIMTKTTQASTMIHWVRQKLYLSQTQGVFLYLANGTLIQRDMVLGELYDVHKDADNYLYLILATQERLGRLV